LTELDGLQMSEGHEAAAMLGKGIELLANYEQTVCM
jgi:hypothetical protein